MTVVKLTPPPETVRDPAVYDYLYQMQEYLALALENAARGADGTAVAGGTSGGAVSGAVADALQEQFQTLKSLIIKTADTVERHTQTDLSGLRTVINDLRDIVYGEEGLQATLATVKSSYVAQGDFGTYKEDVSSQFTATVSTLTQHIERTEDVVSSNFDNYINETEGYICSGIVYYDNGDPVIGIAVGQGLRHHFETVDGKQQRVVDQIGFRAIYGARELSFWQGETKVAYMSNNRLYITDVTALETLTVGNWSVSGIDGFTVKWIGGAV